MKNRLLALVAALLLTAIPSFAQTTLNSTTLSVAVNASDSAVTVASISNISVGDLIFMDREAMRVTVVPTTGTRLQVSRGASGTAARAHAASITVYTGAPARFYNTEVVGTCTAANELYTPRIVLPTGNVYTCTGGQWNRVGPDVGTIQASFVQGATAADALDTIFFIADRDYVVTKITAIWGTAESTGSMDIMVEKLTGTTACASGTDLMSAAIAGTGTANTLNTATLTATSANLLVAAGNRLCVDLTATPNEVVNMVVTVTLVPR